MQVDDKIYFNNFGVCQIVNIEKAEGNETTKEAYTLKPLYGQAGIVKVFSDNPNLRPLLNKDEIIEMLKYFQSFETVWENKYIYREMLYSKIKADPDPIKRICMLKTIYNRYLEKKSQGIKGGLSYRDMEFYHKSLDLVTWEIKESLDIEMDDVKDFIYSVTKDDSIFEYYIIK